MSEHNARFGAKVAVNNDVDKTVSLKSKWLMEDGYTTAGVVYLDKQDAYSLAADILTRIDVLPADLLALRATNAALERDLVAARATVERLRPLVEVLAFPNLIIYDDDRDDMALGIVTVGQRRQARAALASFVPSTVQVARDAKTKYVIETAENLAAALKAFNDQPDDAPRKDRRLAARRLTIMTEKVEEAVDMLHALLPSDAGKGR